MSAARDNARQGPQRGRLLIFAVAAACLMLVVTSDSQAVRSAAAEEPWSISSFDAHYTVNRDGSITSSEDLVVEFGSLQRHGIFRDIPVEYQYDAHHNRLISLDVLSVDDGTIAIPYETSRVGPNERIKIGDPDKLVTGRQRYRINSRITGALNPFADHDEFYWNVTGHEWPVTIDKAVAKVQLPEPGISEIGCFQGPTGSRDVCQSSGDRQNATFASTIALHSGSELTLTVGLQNGLVDVPAPTLKSIEPEGVLDKLAHFFRFTPLIAVLFVLSSLLILGFLVRQWWITGRDRWFGDRYYFNDSAKEEIKPPFSRETVVVEYQPPEIPGRGRRLRPAEIGLLLDERADTLDVSATIVDLAVRGYLKIEELPREGLLGKNEFELTKLKNPDRKLLRFERMLMLALFRRRTSVQPGELSWRSYTDLLRTKDELYREAVTTNKFFPRDPESVRSTYQKAGLVTCVIGWAALVALAVLGSGGLLPVPFIIGGLALYLLAGAMPRRTAFGRELYRRSLGFRSFMVTAEKRRQAFAEKVGIFDEYLPYAMVYHCAKKWAELFEKLDVRRPAVSWYVTSNGAAPLAIAVSMRGFTASISAAASTPPSTPGAAGFSGFSGGGFGGGGFAGGGVGGGGGGSW